MKRAFRKLFPLFSIVTAIAGFRFMMLKGWLDPTLEKIPVFSIREVKISTEWPIKESLVQQTLGKLEGKSLLALNSEKAVEMLKSRPWVEDVLLRKEFPDHLLIDIRATKAEAILVKEGTPFFLAKNGKIIERVSPNVNHSRDFSLITVSSSTRGWELRSAMYVLEKLSKGLPKSFVVSEVLLGNYPLFEVYLGPVRLEVSFSFDNWENQLPNLVEILTRPPQDLETLRKINLIFPKKAIVSSNLSN